MAEAYHSGTRNVRKMHTQSFKGKFTPRFRYEKSRPFEQNLMNNYRQWTELIRYVLKLGLCRKRLLAEKWGSLWKRKKECTTVYSYLLIDRASLWWEDASWPERQPCLQQPSYQAKCIIQFLEWPNSQLANEKQVGQQVCDHKSRWSLECLKR